MERPEGRGLRNTEFGRHYFSFFGSPCIKGMHIGAIWEIQLNDPCAPAMRLCVMLLC